MAVLKDLIVHGASRFLGDVYFNFLKANDIAAETGYFKKLTAIEGTITDLTSTNLVTKNATVMALLDVQGDMHTNSWSNSNIATIDGSFYITPTSISTDGSDTSASNYTPTGTIAYTSPNFTKISVTGTFDTSQLVLDSNSHVPWPASSEVIITGDVLVGNEWLPLGTIRGKLESQVAATNASKTISIIPLSSTLTDGQGHNPVTLEAIRVGINLTSGTSSSLKMRKVKISLTSRANGSNQYPVGILLSAQGTGTGQTFIDIYGGNSLRNGQSGTINGVTKYFTKPVVRIGNLEGLPKLANQTPSGWGIYTSNGFFEGAIVAKEGYIGNTDKYWIIGGGTSSGATYMYCGPSTISATSTAGTYLGTDGFLNTVSTTKYAQITNGVLTAKGASIAGEISAQSGVFGQATSTDKQIKIGTNTTNASIYSGSHSALASTTDGFYLGADGLSIGSNFSVTSAGVLTATDANLKNLTIYDSSGNKRAGVTTSGFIVYDGTSATTTTEIAKFGSTVYIGKYDGTQSHLEIDFHSLQLKDKEGEPYFYVSDLRNESGVATITEIFRGNGTQTSFNFQVDALNTSYTVTVSDSSGGTVARSSGGVSFSNAPNDGSKITATYTTNSSHVKVYTCGTRKSGSTDGIYSFVEGRNNIGSGSFSHAEGSGTKAESLCSHAEGQDSAALSFNAHAEGWGTTASGENSHAEGGNTNASGKTSHAEGSQTEASGMASHAEGYHTLADGYASHAEGEWNEAIGSSSHAEGGFETGSGEVRKTVASGTASHAEGIGTTASGNASHAEGDGTTASGNYSHAGGFSTIAGYEKQTVIGEYNDNKSQNAFEIGNGTANNARSNAFTVGWNGNATATGNIYQGSNQVTDKSMFACGTTSGLSMAAGATNHTTISFNKTFSSAPNVVVSFYSESTAYTDIGKCSCWVTNVTTTGCTIYTYNGSSNTRAPAVRWQAMLI